MKSFAAQLKDIAGLVKEDMIDVAQGATEDVVFDMQQPVAKGGRLPVVTANLRNSLASGLNGSFGPEGADSYVLVISRMDIGDVARFAYTAEYARRVNSGFSGTDSLGRKYEQEGRHFVTAAAAKFPDYVAARSKRIRRG